MNQLICLIMLSATSTIVPLGVHQTTRPDEAKTNYRIVSSRTGRDLSLGQLADELTRHDIVYFGELHDNEHGHKVYAELAGLLAARRQDIVIALEMFERDVQGVITDYLRGKIDEVTFLKHSRPWKNYARDYKPLIELARERKFDVIAGNIPRPVAAKLASKEGSNSPFLARSNSAPLDRYWELFNETMKSHPNAEGAVERMYRAQCAKDDAMAEGIAEYLATHPHRQPFVIQCNGNFHSDYGLGTAARVMQRVPLGQASIISMVETTDVTTIALADHLKKCHYLLVVRAMPKPVTDKQESKPSEKGKVLIPNRK